MTFADLTYEKIRTLNSAAYIYSENVLRQRIETLRQALPSAMGIYYSLKANSNERLLSQIRRESLGVDVASSKELEMALKCGFSAESIELTGPGKTSDLLHLALQHQVGSMVVESVDELLLLARLASEVGTKISICVRINPTLCYSPQGREMKNQASQFGIDEEQMPNFFSTLESCPSISLSGFHIYTQSQLLDSSVLTKNFEAAFDSALRCLGIYGSPLSVVHLGGGFGIEYFEGQKGLELESLRGGLELILARAKEHPLLQSARICVESGRFLSGPAGVYVSQVQYLKHSGGKKIAVLNGGFSQNMAVCGMGQLLRRNYKLKVLGPSLSETSEVVTLAGPSCYSLDILAQDVNLPLLQKGDFIVFQNCGSYGASFSPQNFLGLPLSQEIFLEDL